MVRKPRTVHVDKITNTVKGVTYTSYYLRRSYREDGKVKHETLGNLSDLPLPVIDLIRRSLKGETFVPAAELFRNVRSRPHGHVEAILTMIRRLGLDSTIASQPSRQRDRRPGHDRRASPLPLLQAGHHPALARHHPRRGTPRPGRRRGRALCRHGLAARAAEGHRGQARAAPLGEGVLVLYDVSSSYYEGERCPLARYGHDRDGKTGRPIIVYGVLTDADGRPVAVQVYPGDTGDPPPSPIKSPSCPASSRLSRIVLVGDRGMLTQTQINTLKEHPGLGWISALRSDAIRGLLADGHLNRSLFDEVNLAEIASPDFPGERLLACYNPLLAEKRARKREALLAATEERLTKLARAVSRRTEAPLSAAAIGVKAGRVIGRHKMAKHIKMTICDGTFTWKRDDESINREKLLDGIYVIRTSEPAERLSAADGVRSYKRLAQVEQAFRCLKGIDPAGAADPPPAGAAGACACPDLRPGVLRGMAPASGLAPAAVRG